MKIGIFGGSFDPPHKGHIKIAQLCCDKFELDKLIFVPTGVPYYKKAGNTQPVHRYNMTKLAAEPYGFEVSDIEVNSTQYTYTCDTVLEFKKRFPDDTLYFIVGADSLDYMQTWKNPETIFENCEIIAAARETAGLDNKKLLEARYNAKIHFLNNEEIDISSSQIRSAASENRPCPMLETEVYEYIMNNALYKVYDFEKIKEAVKPLLKPKRYTHSLGVMDLAGKLARHYNCDAEKAMLAGLLHDCAKQLDSPLLFNYLMRSGIKDELVISSRGLWHGPASAVYAKEHFDIDDEVYDAIYYHTIGKRNMSLFTKIVFLADALEVNRDEDFEWSAQLRAHAFEDIDDTLLQVLNLTIVSIIDRGFIMHPNSVEIRNDLLACSKEEQNAG